MSPITAPSAINGAMDILRPERLAPSDIAAPGRETSRLGADPAFGRVFEGMIRQVEERQAIASAATRDVLLGDSPNLHQSIIARQEAALSFSLLVEVRNKVVESYQELMRMPV
jgi:flagellar hook-basal body complex protein FliE